MAKYEQYAEYKDSGVEWLGEIPKDWKLKRIQESTSIINGYPFESSKFNPTKGMPLVRIRDIRHQKTEVFFDGVVPEAAVINNGDILIGMDGDFNVAKWNGGTAALNQRVACIRHENPIIQSFLYYLLPYHMKIVNDLTYYTTVKHLSSNDILKTTFALPSENELKNIVSFLNHETAQIDTLIEKQQTLIQLLKEKRQAVISHAVTKGLNPDAPMKDSEVEWLGDVPEHWEVKRVRHAFDIDNNLRTPINRQSRSEMEGDFRYYGPTGVLNLINRYNVEGQYFLLGEDGDHFLKFEEKPMTIYVKGKFNVNNHAHLIKGKGSCSTKWGCLYFEHKDLFPWLIKQGVGRYKLQKTVLLDIPVAIPPLEEQEFILNEVRNKKIYFSEIEKRTEALISLLKERRTALISAAVTGKIDVRGWQVPE